MHFQTELKGDFQITTPNIITAILMLYYRKLINTVKIEHTRNGVVHATMIQNRLDDLVKVKYSESVNESIPCVARLAACLSCSTWTAVPRKKPPPQTHTKHVMYSANCRLA